MAQTADNFFSQIPEEVKVKKPALLTSLKALGVPSAKSEDYTYIDTHKLQDYLGAPASSATVDVTESMLPPLELPSDNPRRIVLLNGQFSEKLSQGSFTDIKIATVPTEGANLIPFPGNKKPGYLSKGDFFHTLNELYRTHTTTIDVSDNVKGSAPLEILNLVSVGPQFSQPTPRFDSSIQIKVGKSSEVSFLFSNQILEPEVKAMHNTTLHVELGEDSKVEGVFTGHFSDTQIEWMRLQSNLGAASQFTGHKFTKGSHLTRHSIETRLNQSHAHFNWVASAVTDNKRQVHEHLTIHHNVPETFSSHTVKNILKGGSRTSVDGTIIVQPKAQMSKSNQLINNLMLSDEARANTKPNLMIYADDVKCTHGATVGGLDAQQLFYLESRGLNRQQALGMLTESYLNTNIAKIQDPILQKHFYKRITDYLH